MEILTELLKAHEYWSLMDLKVDLIILCDEEYNYLQPLFRLISDIVAASQIQDIANKPGIIYILERNKMPAEEINLLYAVARVTILGDGRTLGEQIGVQIEQLLPNKIEFSQVIHEFERQSVDEQELILFNGLGGFSKDGKEYVIRLEKGLITPAPWINVIANPKFGFTVSESGAGYTWFGNSRENKLTPWSNDIVCDTPGEVFYIGDAYTGQRWTLACLPLNKNEPSLVQHTIKHGFGYSIFEHSSHGIKQSLTQFVPLSESVKVSLVSIKNISETKRKLTLTYYIRPILGVCDQTTAMHIRTSLDKTGALLIENPYNEEFIGMICFIDSSIKERSITSDRREFFGSGDLSSPECLLRECLSGTVGTGHDPCAAIQINVILEPSESKEIVFLLGMASKLQEVNMITNKYLDIKIANEALTDIKEFWNKKLNIVHVDTSDLPMNLMLNGWLPYQVISCRLWARSGFYQSGGAFGFRDQLQDALSAAHIWPEITHAQILLHARHQYTQGDVQHWWHDPNRKGTRTHISDDLLWLPYVTAEYIRITGDKNILAEEVSFLEDTILADNEDERYGSPDISNIKASLYDHCCRAINMALKFGVHGLPLSGTGDWNDGMNTVGNKGLGESVWLGWFLVTVLQMMEPICLE
ncbi:MAG: glycosyl transferase, partial [Eubacteriales bacterium]